MNINPINNTQKNTNFGAIKSIKFVGEFRNAPYAQEKVLNAFEANKTLQQFCQKFDTRIIFDLTCHPIFKKPFYEPSMHICYEALETEPTTFFEKLKSYFAGSNYNERKFFVIEPNEVALSVDTSATALSNKIAKTKDFFEQEMSESRDIKATRREVFDVREIARQEKAEAEIRLRSKQEEINKRIESLLN